MKNLDEIGLFPLGLVLLPHEYVPLHIFEDRYKELIGECVEDETDFGLVFSDEGGMRSFGTRARVVRVIERYPDGRLDVIVKGGGRVRIERLTEGRSFLTAEVAPVGDEIDNEVAAELARCLESYRRLLAAAGADDDVKLEPGSAAYQMAARVDLEPEAKQTLLELRSEKERLEYLGGLFDELVRTWERRRAVRARASGNGRVERR